MITKFNFKDRTIKSYAIRKLTPKECFLLMGVREKVIHIMQQTVKSVKKIIKKVFRRDDGNHESREFDEWYDRIKAEIGKEPKIYQDKVDSIRIVGVKRVNSLGLPYWEFYREDQYDAEKVGMTFEELWKAAEEGDEETIYYLDGFDWQAEAETAEEDDTYRRFRVYTSTPGEYIKIEQKVGTYEPVISASQQYKLAGNSIVVDVLVAIYEQLWYPQPRKPKQQLSMFDTFFPDEALPTYPQGYDPIKHWGKTTVPDGSPSGEKVILTTFSGYDSQLMACEALKERHPDFRWTCVGWSDIDKYACQMHDLVFPQYADRALGDITKIDWHKLRAELGSKEIDLFTYSSPCQDISQAGKQMGLKEGSGSRSALLWNVADAVEILRPKYLLQENVAALVSEKFMPDFQLWLKRLEELGYVSKWQRLNSKDYGVPQNRDRVFVISMRKDCAFDYQFPAPMPLEKRLEDILEPEVDEKYFLKDDAVSKFLKANDKDTALFHQFALPPLHEDAMFLKTWLQCLMEYQHGWDKTPTELETLLTTAERIFPYDPAKREPWLNIVGFRTLFDYNVKRNDGGRNTKLNEPNINPQPETVTEFIQMIKKVA